MNDLVNFILGVSPQVPHLKYTSAYRATFGLDESLPQASFIKLQYRDVTIDPSNKEFGYLCKLRPHDPKDFLLRFTSNVQATLLTGVGNFLTGDSIKKINSKARITSRATFDATDTHWTYVPETESMLVIVSDKELFTENPLDDDDTDDLIYEFNRLLNPVLRAPTYFSAGNSLQ